MVSRKPGQHRERRAQFVRHVGDEIAAHRLELVESRDVARQQELLRVAVGNDLHRKDRAAAARRAQFKWLRVIAGLDVGDEFRLAHEVDHRLAGVGLDVEVEMGFRSVVAPFDPIVGIENDHAVGMRARGLAKTHERLGKLLVLAGLYALETVQQRENVIPRTAADGHLAGDWTTSASASASRHAAYGAATMPPRRRQKCSTRRSRQMRDGRPTPQPRSALQSLRSARLVYPRVHTEELTPTIIARCHHRDGGHRNNAQPCRR